MKPALFQLTNLATVYVWISDVPRSPVVANMTCFTGADKVEKFQWLNIDGDPIEEGESFTLIIFNDQ